MIAGGICVVALKNPVSSAMGMIGSFIGLAALLIGLNAYFVGTLQVLVYAGAIMVLFIFIIMLLDLKKESNKEFHATNVAAGIIIPLLLVVIITPVFLNIEKDFKKLDIKALVEAEANLPKSEAPAESIIREKLKIGELADVNFIGHKLYTVYNFPLQVVGVLLLVATIGCVTLSKKLHGSELAADGPDEDLRMAKTIAKSDEIPKVATLPVNEENDEGISLPADTTESNGSESEASEDETDNDKLEDEEEVIEEETSNTPKEEEALLPAFAKEDEKLGLIYNERPDDVDDLTEIKGIGPVLEEKLNNFGIYTFKQISEWSDQNISEFDDLLSFKGRIDRDDWLTQAKEFQANKSK